MSIHSGQIAQRSQVVKKTDLCRQQPRGRAATLCCIENFKGSFSQNSDLVPFVSQILPWLLLGLQPGLQKLMYQRRCVCSRNCHWAVICWVTQYTPVPGRVLGTPLAAARPFLPLSCQHQTQVRGAGSLTNPSLVSAWAGQGWLARLEPGLHAGGRVSGEAGQLPALFRAHSWVVPVNSESLEI